MTEDQEQAIYASILAGRKIEAIKRHREATHAGLKESKNFIDELERQLRAEMPERFAAPDGAKRGCAVMMMLAGLTAIALLAL